MASAIGKSWFSGKGWGQQLFNFQSLAVQWMARTSSLNYLSCTNPYQAPDSLNCLPPFHWKTLFFTEKCFVASPSQKSALNRCPCRRCGVDIEIPYRLPFWREFCLFLSVRVAPGVDAEFPYRARIVDRGVDCRDPVCRHRFRFLDERQRNPKRQCG